MAVHRIDALEDDQLGRFGRIVLEQRFQMLRVVMPPDALLAAAMADALDHRGVVLLIGKDHQAGDQLDERRERGVIGDIGRGEDERRLLAVQVGKLGLELDMIMGGAGDVAGAARAGADAIDRLVHGGAHFGVLAHAEIVVRAPHRHRPRIGLFRLHALGEMHRVRIGPAAALDVGEDPVSAFPVQLLDPVLENLLVVHHRLPSGAWSCLGISLMGFCEGSASILCQTTQNTASRAPSLSRLWAAVPAGSTAR